MVHPRKEQCLNVIAHDYAQPHMETQVETSQFSLYFITPAIQPGTRTLRIFRF